MLVFDYGYATAAADDDDDGGNYCHYNYVCAKASGMKSSSVRSTSAVVQFQHSVSYSTDIRCLQGHMTASLGCDTLWETSFSTVDVLSVFTVITTGHRVLF
jgi:hypothetical protein